MNDPLKKYINDNRDDFDNLEPSADIFLRLKREINNSPKEKKGMILMLTNYKWIVAASVLITLSLTYLLLSKETAQNINTQQIVKVTEPKLDKVVAAQDTVTSIKTTPKYANRKSKKPVKQKDMPTAYRDLTDSTSSSTRLAAILSIQKSNTMSYDMIDKLAKTLNHDSNSNVRLAALNLMARYADDSYVNHAFMLSLSNQKDPLLQLGLMELLWQTNHPKLDDKLYALANDPTTLPEVKDQAYLILINQNKL